MKSSFIRMANKEEKNKTIAQKNTPSLVPINESLGNRLSQLCWPLLYTPNREVRGSILVGLIIFPQLQVLLELVISSPMELLIVLTLWSLSLWLCIVGLSQMIDNPYCNSHNTYKYSYQFTKEKSGGLVRGGFSTYIIVS